MSQVIQLVFWQLIVQYVPIIHINYHRKVQQGQINQLSVAKLSLKVIMNNLNQAVILRTEDGKIGYCNLIGLHFVKQVSQGTFENDWALKKYLK